MIKMADSGGDIITVSETGVSGNPGGRPRDDAISDALRIQLAASFDSERSIAEEIAKKLISMALDGDLGAIREVLDRTEGKPRQAIDMDLQGQDWREVARREGFDEGHVIREFIRLLIEASDDGSTREDEDQTLEN